MNTTQDTFENIVSDIVSDIESEEEFDTAYASGFPAVLGRRSIKYGAESDTLGSMGTYVFAPDPFQAEEKVRQEFNIPEEEHIRIWRMTEGQVDRTRHSKATAPIAPRE